MLILREFGVLRLCKWVNSAHLRWINPFFRRRRPFFLPLFVDPVRILSLWWWLWLPQFLSNYLPSLIQIVIIMIGLFPWLAAGCQQWVPLSLWVRVLLPVGVVVRGAWVLLLLLVVDHWVGEGAVGWSASTCFICDVDWLVQNDRWATQIIVIPLRHIPLILLLSVRHSEIICSIRQVHGITAWVPDLLIIPPIRVPTTSPVKVRRVSATGSRRQRGLLLLHLLLRLLLVTYYHCVLIPATASPVVLSATGAVETKKHTV